MPHRLTKLGTKEAMAKFVWCYLCTPKHYALTSPNVVMFPDVRLESLEWSMSPYPHLHCSGDTYSSEYSAILR